jgi:hypothetical protein
MKCLVLSGSFLHEKTQHRLKYSDHWVRGAFN